MIAIAYFSIPIMLVYFAYKLRNMLPIHIFLMFGSFIILCGIGHLLEIWTLWHPDYWISGIEQAATALVSCYTAGSLVTLLPQFLSLKSPEELAKINAQLQEEVERRRAIGEELRALNQNLEQVVKERTQELWEKNAALKLEIQERQAIQAEIVQRSAADGLLAKTLQQVGKLSINRWVVLNEVTQEIRSFLTVDRVMLYRFEEDWSGSIITESVNDPDLSLLDRVFHDPCFQEQKAEFYHAGNFKAIENIETDEIKPCHQDFLRQLSVKSILILPIILWQPQKNLERSLSNVEQKFSDLIEADKEEQPALWGLLIAHECQAPRSWSQFEIEALQRLSLQLGIAIQQSDLVQCLIRYEEESRSKAESLAQALNHLKETQAQLVHSEKMASLGQMVAGIAHEINNPLSFIYGNLDHASEYTQDLIEVVSLHERLALNVSPDKNRELLERLDAIDTEFIYEDFPTLLTSMQVGAKRIRDIVLSLRNFSRLDEADRKVVSLHEGIESTLNLLKGQLLQSANQMTIRLDEQYDLTMPPLECYPSSLNQALFNIISNAIDALKARSQMELEFQPVLSIKTFYDREIDLDAGNLIPINEAAAGQDWAVVEISDNGLEIPPANQDHIFDPFFTTKPIGKGTGLGLSQAYQIIVKQHQGKLTLSVNEEGFKVFSIALPLRR
ncbi:MAG: GAF domain-containing protein [Coleofasciculaceae cyanobacterium RL_1_1]|nr:GAF domain-containing protein [Coleofasciculaceae cyanobacterium RL_1_1]